MIFFLLFFRSTETKRTSTRNEKHHNNEEKKIEINPRKRENGKWEIYVMFRFVLFLLLLPWRCVFVILSFLLARKGPNGGESEGPDYVCGRKKSNLDSGRIIVLFGSASWIIFSSSPLRSYFNLPVLRLGRAWSEKREMFRRSNESS